MRVYKPKSSTAAQTEGQNRSLALSEAGFRSSLPLFSLERPTISLHWLLAPSRGTSELHGHRTTSPGEEGVRKCGDVMRIRSGTTPRADDARNKLSAGRRAAGKRKELGSPSLVLLGTLVGSKRELHSRSGSRGGKDPQPALPGRSSANPRRTTARGAPLLFSRRLPSPIKSRQIKKKMSPRVEFKRRNTSLR